MKQLIRYIQAAVFLAVSFVNAQHYNFRVFTQENGLPQSYIYAFRQTSDGYLAVGTGEGLSVTGGGTFKTYTTKNGLAENFVTALENDSKGRLWIGHYQNGITVADDKNYSIFKGYPENGGPVNCLFHFDNKIWVGNRSNNFCYIEDDKFQKIPHKILNHVNAFTSSGNILIAATGNGIFFGKKENGKYNFTQSPLTVGLNITAIENIGDSILICGDEKGVIRIAEFHREKQEADFRYVLILGGGNPVRDILTDVWNNIWIASFGGGIEKLRVQDLPNPSPLQKTTINEKNGLDNLFVQCLYRDREENIWIGTFGGGIYMLENDNLLLYDKKNGLFEEEILSVASLGNKLFTGTTTGLQSCTLPSGTDAEMFTKKNGFVNDEVKCLAVSRDKKLMIGTRNNGAFFYDRQKNRFTALSIVSPDINHINVVSDTLVLISTVDGLYFYNPKSNQSRQLTTEEGLPHNHIVQTLVDKKGNIWIAAHRSPLAMLSNDEVTLFKDIELFKSFSITSLCMDRAGNIYFGSDGDGLFYQKGNEFKRKTVDDGLCSNYIYGLVFDSVNNSVICTHRNGLSKWNPSDELIHRLNKKEKLSAFENNLNAIYSDPALDIIFFGTSQGVSVYQSSRARLNYKPPVFHVLALTVNSKPYPVTDSVISLPYNNYNIRIDYLGISFRSSEEVRYFYQLQGLQNDFKTTSERFVEFPKLHEGDYVFKIYAMNADGIRSAVPYTIRISIDKPLYKKLWFILLTAATLIFLTWMVFRFRLKRLERANQLLAEKVREATQEIEEDKRIIEEINKDLESKNLEITSSIDYAKRIQLALLPKKRLIQKHLDSVIFYKPRDIVSGDFYWFHETANWYYFAVVDCTGHGVPGAFMSIIGSNFLEQTMAEKEEPTPAEVLHEMDRKIVSSLKQRSGDAKLKDGMDVALCRISKDKTKVMFSGAARPLWHISTGVMKEYLSPLFPIGGYYEGIEKRFKDAEITIKPGDWIYLSSDGFGDQFGGPQKKRYSARKFKDLITALSAYSTEQQYAMFRNEFKDWKGEDSQVDDILVAGIKF